MVGLVATTLGPAEYRGGYCLVVPEPQRFLSTTLGLVRLCLDIDLANDLEYVGLSSLGRRASWSESVVGYGRDGLGVESGDRQRGGSRLGSVAARAIRLDMVSKGISDGFGAVVLSSYVISRVVLK